LRRQLTLLAPQEGQKTQVGADIKQVGDFQVMVRHFTDVPTKDLKSLIDDLKKQIRSGVIIVTSQVDGKVSLVVGVTPDLTDRMSAVDLVRAGSVALGGSGGGGRPDLAQAGGIHANVSAAIAAIEDRLRQ